MKERFDNRTRSMTSLFESGRSISDIARKLGTTKQNISKTLRNFYRITDPPIYKNEILHRTCIVCGCEEEMTLKITSVSQLKALSLTPVIHTEKIVCSLCKEYGIHLCTSCGSLGYLGGEFLKKPINKKKQRAMCLTCNRDNHQIWVNKNPKRSQELFNSYRSKKRKELHKKGLCVSCGKPNESPELKTCPNCRNARREYIKAYRQKKQ